MPRATMQRRTGRRRQNFAGSFKKPRAGGGDRRGACNALGVGQGERAALLNYGCGAMFRLVSALAWRAWLNDAKAIVNGELQKC
jgi:hypothetical protein